MNDYVYDVDDIKGKLKELRIRRGLTQQDFVDKFKEKKHYEIIRDNELREIACSSNNAFNKMVEEKSIKGIRVLKKENPIIKIKDKSGKEYKAFAGGNNVCVEIYEVEGVRKSEVIQLFDAAQKGFKPKWMSEYPNGKLLMRLFKGDVIGFIEKEKSRNRMYYIIQQIRKELFALLPINGFTSSEKKMEFKSYSPLFNTLNAEQFNISPTGIVTKKKTADSSFWKNRK